ncbi:MAG: DAK2 domain-containing protein [Actinomycetaceae bacterium]|nr:DAK2 domain-containing protein [Actinomycetaceae bacterium]
MTVDAQTLILAIRTAAEEARRLASFVDDLDGWEMGDCDTGTNAYRTLQAISRALPEGEQHTMVSALDTACAVGIRQAHGHIGVILTEVFASWSRCAESFPDAPLTPVETRRLLNATLVGSPLEDSLHPAIHAVLREGRDALGDLGDTLPEVGDVVSTYSLQGQVGLIDETSATTDRINAGAAVLVILLACVDAAVNDSDTSLVALARMLADLAAREGAPAPRTADPLPGRDFTADVIVEGMAEDAAALHTRLKAIGARHTITGHTDFFGMGTWRLHIDTGAPMAVRPRAGRIIRFLVADARPDEAIGEDQLSDGVSHRGVRLLERRPRMRVQRATVVVCTRSPDLVEDFARTGATVLLNPVGDDRDAFIDAANASTVGFALFLPCDEASARLAASIAADMAADLTCGTAVEVGPSRDELTALALARATAPVFVPQPGGPTVAPLMATVLREAMAQTLAATRIIDVGSGPAEETIPASIPSELPMGAQVRILVGDSSDEDVVPIFRHVLDPTSYWGVQVEILHRGAPGPTLLQVTQ